MNDIMNHYLLAAEESLCYGKDISEAIDRLLTTRRRLRFGGPDVIESVEVGVVNNP